MEIGRGYYSEFSSREFLHFPKEALYRKLARDGADMIDVQDPFESIDEYYFLRQNRTPIVYANHESHMDGGALVKVSQLLNKPGNIPMEFKLPLAASLRTGDQSSKHTEFYNAMKPWMIENHIHPVEVAREADREKYNIKAATDQSRELLSIPSSRDGIMIFPQGSVQAGRINPETGKRFGMIEVKNDLIPRIVRRSVAQHSKDVAFLPVAIHGTYRLFDPGVPNDSSTAHITREAKQSLMKKHMGFRPKLATAIIGEPFTTEELEQNGIDLRDKEAINTFLMNRIAEMLPEDARGYYR